MSTEEPMQDTSPNQPEKQTTAKTKSEKAAEKKPRRRRRWLWILGGFVVLLLVLIALAPTIASTAMVRNIVVGKINDQLKGRVVIDDWSISWFSGVRVTGMKVYDVNGSQVAQCDALTTQLKLTDAIRGNLALGEIVPAGVVDFNFTQYPDGTSTLDRLLKPQPETKESSDLPKMSGHLKLTNASGTFTRQAADPKLSHFVKLSSVSGDITITDINAPIEDQLVANVAVDNGQSGKVTMSGRLAAIANQRLNLDSANLDQTIQLQGVNAAVATPFLPPTIVRDVHGLVDATLTLKMVNGKSMETSGRIDSPELSYTSATAKDGEAYVAQKVAIVISNLQIAMPQGMMHPEVMTLNLAPGAAPVTMTAQLSPALANAIGNFINNPALVRPDSTQGVATLALTECSNVPMGPAALSHAPENKGHAVLTYSFGGIQLGNQFIADAARYLSINPKSFQGSIKDGRATYDRGYVGHDMLLLTGEQGRVLHLYGTTDAATGNLQPFTMLFSQGWLPSKWSKFLPKGLPVSLTGSFTSPQYSFETALQEGLKQNNLTLEPENIGNIIGQFGKKKDDKKPGGDATTQPAGQQKPDATSIIGGLLDKATKDKKDKDKK
jgi:hypothetical protein